jgi:hypothetical protein
LNKHTQGKIQSEIRFIKRLETPFNNRMKIEKPQGLISCDILGYSTRAGLVLLAVGAAVAAVRLWNTFKVEQVGDQEF